MNLGLAIAVLLAATCTYEVASQNHALFVKKDAIDGKRVARQTPATSASADQMVQNILQWLQGVYTQNSRRIRQGTLREYLPPINTQKPRPFQPVTYPPSRPTDREDNNIEGGYPPAGVTPQPPFTYPSTSGHPSPDITPPVSHPNFNGNGYPTSPQPFPPFPTEHYGSTTRYPPYFPSSSTEYPTGYPTHPTSGYPSPSTGYPTPPPTSGYPGPSTGYPTRPPPSGYPSPSTGYQTQPPTSSYPSPSTEYPTSKPKPFSTTGYPTPPPTNYPSRPTDYPTTFQPDTTRPLFTSPQQTSPSYVTTYPPPDHNTIPNPKPGIDHVPDNTQPGSTIVGPPDDDDLKHPPHIHAITVDCGKEMMTINIEFNRPFDGIIYSKGYYNRPECVYVKANTGRIKYSFTVSLNSCGTEFINAFDTQGQSYLENILVLQNEVGIQEVWDTIRAVRCLWEGNLKKNLNVALSVGMLNQEIVTFSGDTAAAKLDIQLGRGPFAPPAHGLIKIGEVMTLVVSVTGDPGFDIQVKDCKAKDATGSNVVALIDDNGCVLKPKLFGAFQKTRNTGNTGASIIAFAFFNAFRFPDVMDLILECNVDLCKTDCEVCPDPNQKLEPGRRRKREVHLTNDTVQDNSVTMGKHLTVFLPEDLSDSNAVINLQREGICLSTQSFVLSSALLVVLLTSSCLFSSYMWIKHRLLLKR